MKKFLLFTKREGPDQKPKGPWTFLTFIEGSSKKEAENFATDHFISTCKAWEKDIFWSIV